MKKSLDLDANNSFGIVYRRVFSETTANYFPTDKWVMPLENAIGKKFKVMELCSQNGKHFLSYSSILKSNLYICRVHLPALSLQKVNKIIRG